MDLLGALSYGVACLVFALLGGLLLLSRQARAPGGRLIVAALLTALWAAILAGDSSGMTLPSTAVFWVDVLRDVAWLLVLSGLAPALAGPARHFGEALVVPAIAGVILILALLYHHDPADTPEWLVRIGLVVPLTGLTLTAHLYLRNDAPSRWALAPLAAGLAVVFGYDAFLFSSAALLQRSSLEAWSSRGFVNVLAVPLLALAARRNPRWSLDVFVSRQVVLFGGAVLAAGTYLVIALLVGHSLQLLGGAYGALLRLLFVGIAVALLTAAVASMSLRRHAYVFLIKHFYKNKYDYRREWLRFVDTLSGTGESDVRRTSIRAVAQIFGSPGGALLTPTRGGQSFAAVTSWPLSLQELELREELPLQDALCSFLQRTRWIVDLEELRRTPDSYEGLQVPAWLCGTPRWRIVIPMIGQEHLLGIMLLESPYPEFDLTFEDRDLMRTAACHVAARIAQQETDRRLAEAKQFEAYNRLAAFMMHDLQNSAAQLQLIVANAAHHRHNPAFVDDAIDTIANAARRIGDLIRQLKGEGSTSVPQPVDLEQIVTQTVHRCADRQPVAGIGQLSAARIYGEPGKLASVLEHIIRNAQHATPADGRVTVSLHTQNGAAHLVVDDTGCGMDDDFVRQRLFTPFDSTKGPAGMGIGAYQVREYVLALGGEVRVASRPAAGTRFTIILPLAR